MNVTSSFVLTCSIEPMRVMFLRCGAPEFPVPDNAEVLDLSPIPTRAQLKPVDAAATAILPEDPTPSLDEIQAQPDVAHLGAPQFAPQPIETPLRVVVIGSDAALSAVLTRLMRADNMWVEVGFVPVGDSTAARVWGLPSEPRQALDLARGGEVKPVPLIRNDSGTAVAGCATISQWDNSPLVGEIVADDHTLAQGDGTAGTYGARLVPMVDAPGILSARAISPVEAPQASGLSGWFKSKFGPEPGKLDAESVRTGRAVQAGGPQLRVIVDGVPGKRAVTRVTFYRHLRDLQIVRG